MSSNAYSEIFSALASLDKGETTNNLDKLRDDVASALLAFRQSLAGRDEAILRHAVQFSMQASEAMAATTRITGEVRETDTRSQSMAAAVEELTASIDQIATTATGVAGSMEEVSAGMRCGAQATEQTAQASRKIGEAFQRMTASADHLAIAAEQIGTFVATIDGLTQQTNLLALNATIEAARAGEAGKGFAVVASEVKVLSGHTEKATDDIRARIERLGEHVEEVLKTVHDVQILVEQSVSQSEDAASQIVKVLDDVAANGERMSEIAIVLSQQSEAVQEISEGAQAIAAHAAHSDAFSGDVIKSVGQSEEIAAEQLQELEKRSIPNFVLHKAKADHLMWNKRLSEMLAGLSSLHHKEISDHRHCDLGIWYAAVTDERIRRHPAFSALLPVHEAVHKCAREAARLHAQSDREGALEAARQLDVTSRDVVRDIDAPNRGLRKLTAKGASGRAAGVSCPLTPPEVSPPWQARRHTPRHSPARPPVRSKPFPTPARRSRKARYRADGSAAYRAARGT